MEVLLHTFEWWGLEQVLVLSSQSERSTDPAASKPKPIHSTERPAPDPDHIKLHWQQTTYPTSFCRYSWNPSQIMEIEFWKLVMGNLPALSVSTICFKVYSLLQCVVTTTWADWWRLHNLKQTQCCPTWHNFMMIIFSSRLQSWHVIGSTYWPKFPGGLEMVKQGNRDSLEILP